MESLVINSIIKVGLPVGLLVALVTFMFLYFQANSKQQEKSQKFVDKVMKNNKEREEKLITQLDKYNTALQDNNKILNKISNKLEDVKELKKDVEDIKEKLEI